MAEFQKGRWEIVIPAGAEVKAGTEIIGGQAGGPLPSGAVLTVPHTIKNDGSGDMTFSYEYEWPKHEGEDS